MAPDGQMAVTFVYAPRAGEVLELVLVLPVGTKAVQALAIAAGQLSIDAALLENPCVGIWGKKVHPGHVLQAGDRLELYRPLTVDPKVARRERFARQGTRKVPGLFARRRPGSKAGY